MEIECVINDSLPSSWHCAKCIQSGLYMASDKQANDLDEQYESYDENEVTNEKACDSDNESLTYDESFISIDSLSYNEKKIILTEFCDIVETIENDDEMDLKNENNNNNNVFYNNMLIEELDVNNNNNKYSNQEKQFINDDVSNHKVVPLNILNEGNNNKLELIKASQNQSERKFVVLKDINKWKASSSYVQSSFNLPSESSSIILSDNDEIKESYKSPKIYDADIDDVENNNEIEHTIINEDLLWKPNF